MADTMAGSYSDLLISNVLVVDVEQRRALEAQDVLLRNGKIAEIQAHPSNLSAGKRIDGSGKTLIPGLWDMHGHLDTSLGPFYIASGVTSVRDIGSAHDTIMRVEATFNDGRVIGPNVYRSGFMDRFSEYSSGLSVKSLEEAHETIDWFADNGYLQLKLYSSIEPEWRFCLYPEEYRTCSTKIVLLASPEPIPTSLAHKSVPGSSKWLRNMLSVTVL